MKQNHLHSDPLNEFLNGEKLYGNDFSLSEIRSWYEDEKEGYAELGAKEFDKYRYSYHKLNEVLGYRYLLQRKIKFEKVLSIGGGYGDELLPVLDQIGDVFILEPSSQLRREELGGKPLKYISPSVTGEIPFPTDYFSLVTCFGVLHHIPNVETVIKEIHRVSQKGGYVLIREPVVSKGDWRNKRVGLTKRERGIPPRIMREFVCRTGFKVLKVSPCMFPLTFKLSTYLERPFNNLIAVHIDKVLSRIFQFNYHYHSQSIWGKLEPKSYFWVLYKSE